MEEVIFVAAHQLSLASKVRTKGPEELKGGDLLIWIEKPPSIIGLCYAS